MAKPPIKRRGISLGALADSTASLDLLSASPTASDFLTPDQTRTATETAEGDPDANLETILEHLIQLSRLNTDIDTYWRQQTDQLQKQFHLLEQQRDEIAQQALKLQAIERSRQASRRLGILVGLLALAGAGAFGFHAWPRIQDLASDWNRVATGMSQFAPQLQAVGERVTSLTSLTSDIDQMGSAVAALREDVSGMHSDVGSLRRIVDTLGEGQGAMQAGRTRTAAHTMPRNATTMVNPYRGMRPGMPW
jgi:hypothetical protein